jgi:hypothetical protein
MMIRHLLLTLLIFFTVFTSAPKYSYTLGNQEFHIEGSNISSATGSLAPSSLSQGVLLGPDGRRIFGKAIKFTLSNSGGSIVVVNRLYVQVLDATPSREYTFPRGPLAPLIEYAYVVELKANSHVVPITNQIFKYGKGDIDAFAVRITSKDKFLFKFKIVAEGYDVARPDEKYVRETGVYQIAFPEMISYLSLIKSAKRSVDVFLEGGAAYELISECSQNLLSEKIRFRCIVDRDFYYRSGEFDNYIVGCELIKNGCSTARFISQIGYRHFANVTRRRMDRLYIVIDDEAVLTNETKYLLGDASYITDSTRVKAYCDHFNSLWQEEPYLSEGAYKEIFAISGDIEQSFSEPRLCPIRKEDRLDEYIFLLRFCYTEQSVTTLTQALSNTNVFIRDEARASLEAMKEVLDMMKIKDENSQRLRAAIARTLPKYEGRGHP